MSIQYARNEEKITCQFCGETGSKEDVQLDEDRGFWCECCDSYNYMNEDEKHNFTLLLERKKDNGSPEHLTKIKYKHFSKRLSPLRYPGGKSKMIDLLYQHLRESKTKRLVSPYAGGSSFELSMLAAGVINELHLNDLDKGIYAFWWTIKNDPEYLINKIKGTTPTHQNYFETQKLIKDNYNGLNLKEAAWCVFLVNRLAYSGIFRANPLGGRQGNVEQLLSRWNADNLTDRIIYTHELSGKIEVTNEDAIELIEEMYWDEETTIFIDPPFIEKGHLLYNKFYKEEDHRKLAFVLESLYSGFPGADILVTYDWHELIEDIFILPNKHVVNRLYSV